MTEATEARLEQIIELSRRVDTHATSQIREVAERALADERAQMAEQDAQVERGQFVDLGSGTPVVLHGRKAVIPRGQWDRERMPDGTFRVRCSVCAKSVSSPLVEPVIVRAWVMCPECIEQRAGDGSKEFDHILSGDYYEPGKKEGA